MKDEEWVKAEGREERRKKEREEETELPLTQLRRGGSPTTLRWQKSRYAFHGSPVSRSSQKKVAEAGVPGQPVPQQGEVHGTEPGDHLRWV